MEDNEHTKPSAASRQAAARREAALTRTAKWRNENAVWPPPPTGQEVPRRAKSAPGLLAQVLVCICQFVGGLILSYAVVTASYGLMSVFIPKHTPHYKPQASEIPAELLETAITLVIVIAMAVVFFREAHAKVFAASLAIGGILCVTASLVFLGM